MSPERITATDPWVVVALDELKGLVAAQYPKARFTVFDGEDPEGIYLGVTVDIEDSSDALMPVLNKLYEIEVERALPVYVVTGQPEERVAAHLADQAKGPRPRFSQLSL